LRKLDFLRHIVNQALTVHGVSAKVTEEVRKVMTLAEARYNFSIYGGNPSKIADFLLSDDWRVVKQALTSSGYSKVVEAILRKVIETYDDARVREIAMRELESLRQESK